MASTLPMPNIKGQFKKNDLKASSQLQMQADQLSFSTTDNKAHAKGNVVVTKKHEELFADELDLDRASQIVVAEGNV